MKKKLILLPLLLLCTQIIWAQDDDFDRSWHIGFFGGMINYHGDLQPNSFSFAQSNLGVSAFVRKHFTKNFSLKAGVGVGKVGASDKYNRDYLQQRNLNFKTNIKDVFLNLEYNLFDLTTKTVTPFAYGSLIAFHFNPYTYDANGDKVYLKPLSTEGQGLAAYPERKEYGLFQYAVGIGGGLRIAPGNSFIISIDAGQRKTFTDYLDDVSTSYVDKDVLLAAKGPKAVELAFRMDEYNGSTYPAHGEQRGTPTEMDWYYYFGVSVEVKMSAFKDGFSNLFSGNRKNWYNQRCPRVD